MDPPPKPTTPPLTARVMAFATEIGVNIVLPFGVYTLTQKRIGPVDGLLAASAPPVLWSIAEFARKRRVDAVSLLAIAGIVLSVLAFFGGGSVKFLQLRENLVTGAIGLIFLGSAVIRKPLIYALARASYARKSAAELSEFEAHRGA